jgi:hypothetical protein
MAHVLCAAAKRALALLHTMLARRAAHKAVPVGARFNFFCFAFHLAIIYTQNFKKSSEKSWHAACSKSRANLKNNNKSNKIEDWFICLVYLPRLFGSGIFLIWVYLDWHLFAAEKNCEKKEEKIAKQC